MVREKTTPKVAKCGKDSRRLSPHKDVSSGKVKKEQQWPEGDMDEVFDINKDSPLDQRRSRI